MERGARSKTGSLQRAPWGSRKQMAHSMWRDGIPPAKTAALANVLMDARTTPQQVSTRGITRLTTERLQEMARQGKTVRLISRGRRTGSGVSLRVRAEVLDRCDILACTPGTSNLILFHTDLMGTFGTVSIEPGVEQTAYGVFSDLVNLSGF